jgi:hypothetical protein
VKFGDEQDTTRGGSTFRACCTEFGLHPADVRESMAHLPPAVRRAFRDRWEVLLYEASGVSAEADLEPQRVIKPGRVVSEAVKLARGKSIIKRGSRSSELLAVLPTDPSLALGLREIAKRLRLTGRGEMVVENTLRRLRVAGQVERVALQTTSRMGRIGYFRVAA